MSTTAANSGRIIENADIDRETPQPEIHVEERRLTLHDFLKRDQTWTRKSSAVASTEID